MAEDSRKNDWAEFITTACSERWKALNISGHDQAVSMHCHRIHVDNIALILTTNFSEVIS
ncbi:hypothetical protein ACNKHR_22685 [Shigella flexneri]